MAGELAETGEHEGIELGEYEERTEEREKGRERIWMVERMGHLKVLRGGEGSSIPPVLIFLVLLQLPVLIRIYLISSLLITILLIQLLFYIITFLELDAGRFLAFSNMVSCPASAARCRDKTDRGIPATGFGIAFIFFLPGDQRQAAQVSAGNIESKGSAGYHLYGLHLLNEHRKSKSNHDKPIDGDARNVRTPY